MFRLFVKLASARVVNPIETGKHYPWLACLLKQEYKKPALQEECKPSVCTGSVISKRHSNNRIFIYTEILTYCVESIFRGLVLLKGDCLFSFTLSRSILTAGHCVCVQYRRNPKLYPKCYSNLDKNHPENQIIFGRDIYYVVGQRIIDERLRSEEDYSEVLYDLPKAKQAFTYSPDDFTKKDIGLLIVDIASWDARFDYNIVRPIELPNEG